jgi:hypothetical protein
MRRIPHIAGMLRCLRDTRGVALVEFAMVFPLLLLFFLGAVELSRYVLINQKLDKADSTIADVVAQSENIQSSDLDQLMNAINEMIKPYTFGANGRIIISDVARSGASTTVRWQYCGGGTLAASSRIGTVGNSASLPSGFTLDDGDDIIVAETFYNFTPIIGTQLLSNGTIYKVAYFKPRLGALSGFTSSCS